jgi:aldose 1-epimerase
MLSFDGRELVLMLISPHGDAGYPGTLSVQLSFKVTDDNELILDYTYSSDQKTVASLTNHVYFNLNGEASNDTADLEIKLNADRYTKAVNLIPDGTTPAVDGSVYDLRQFRKFADFSVALCGKKGKPVGGGERNG